MTHGPALPFRKDTVPKPLYKKNTPSYLVEPIMLHHSLVVFT